MDEHTFGELAYKNGYSKGYEEGIKEAGGKLGFWKWTKDGNRICSECGMLEPDSLPGA